MHNKILTFSFFLISNLFYSQNELHRFFYELTFKPKSLSEYQKKITMVLDVKENKSKFADYHYIVSDSIEYESLMNSQKKGTFERPKSKVFSDFSFTITKDIVKQEVQLTDFILNSLTPLIIGYKENVIFNWKISTEKEKISNYLCQKATVNYGGREWFAWFTTEIPINDGPYKFYGLPGLIVKIEDKDKNYSWKLIGNKKIKNTNANTNFNNITTKFLTKENFSRAFNNYKQNPMNSMKNELSTEVLNAEVPGMNMKLEEYINQEGKKIKDHYLKYSNPIELE